MTGWHHCGVLRWPVQNSLVAFGQMLQIAFVSQAFSQIGLVKPAVVCGAEYQTDLVRVDFDELVC